MKQQTPNLLLLGGPLHGQRRTPDYEPRMEVPAYRAPRSVADYNLMAAAPIRIDTITYERRKLMLGHSIVIVMVPSTYSDEAATRALADFIDGTTPR